MDGAHLQLPDPEHLVLLHLDDALEPPLPQEPTETLGDDDREALLPSFSSDGRSRWS